MSAACWQWFAPSDNLAMNSGRQIQWSGADSMTPTTASMRGTTHHSRPLLCGSRLVWEAHQPCVPTQRDDVEDLDAAAVIDEVSVL